MIPSVALFSPIFLLFLSFTLSLSLHFIRVFVRSSSSLSAQWICIAIRNVTRALGKIIFGAIAYVHTHTHSLLGAVGVEPGFQFDCFTYSFSVRCNSQSDLNYWFNQWLLSIYFCPMLPSIAFARRSPFATLALFCVYMCVLVGEMYASFLYFFFCCFCCATQYYQMVSWQQKLEAQINKHKSRLEIEYIFAYYVVICLKLLIQV